MKLPAKHFRLYSSLCVLALATVAIVIVLSVHHDDSQAISPSDSPNVNLLSGEWNYLPGVSIVKDGLQVTHRGLKIVEQDGSGGQLNPPVNIYGTRVSVSGNFALEATLKDIHGTASLQFYGQPPEVSDEFRVEQPSIRVTINNNQLIAALWDGQATQDLSNQPPVEQQTFSITPRSTVALSVTSQDGQLVFRENGTLLGHIASHNIFKSGAVWIGADAEDTGDSFLIATLSAKQLNGGLVKAINTATANYYAAKSTTGLQAEASKIRPGFLIGTDAALWATANHSYDQTVLGGNFGIITPENAMKWQFIEPQPTVYDFHEADAIVSLARKNGLQVHGHTLVFSEALPSWVRDLPTQTAAQKAYVQQIMVNHITQVVGHFKGNVSEWDVVNEPIAGYTDNGDFPQVLRDNVFYQAMGQQYIQIALEAAHNADPSAKLYINDYGNENDTGARWQATYSLLKNLKAAGAPLYGFGFESHIYNPATDDIANATGDNGQPILENNINALAAIGIKSRISEMDAPQNDPGYAQDNSSQVQQFTGVLSICLHNPNCTTFSMWSLGITDLSQGDGTHPYALINDSVDSPFDQQMHPGAVYIALQKILSVTL
jgi:endo-1,4-beta-xylanase